MKISFLLLFLVHAKTAFEKTVSTTDGIVAFFDNADVDKDGHVTADELHEKMQKDHKQVMAKGIREEILTNWNKDGAGGILKKVVEFPRNSGINITNDADGDGFLTFDEFKNTDHHFLRMTEDDADPSNYLENAGNAFKLADENNDKKLDAEEYICFQHPYLCEHWQTFAQPIVDKEMGRYDTDKNGFISWTELWEGYISRAEKGMTMKEIEDGYLKQMQSEFKQLDGNGDKKLSRAEFQEFVHPDPVRVMHPSLKRQKKKFAEGMVEKLDSDNSKGIKLSELLLGDNHKWLKENAQSHFKEEL